MKDFFSFFRFFQHVLPRGLAWQINFTGIKDLSLFFGNLAIGAEDVADYFDEVFLDIFPSTTRQVDEWFQEFGILTNVETEQEKRDLLDGQWKSQGGQSPGYIQGVLQAAGFNVYVHEWWYIGLDYIDDIICGNTDAYCGNPNTVCSASDDAQFLVRNPNEWVDSDHVLVNNILFAKKNYDAAIICGNADAYCGNPDSLCGSSSGFIIDKKIYDIPLSPVTWVNFWYIGGVTFGEFVDIPEDRKEEFETLVLKIKPRQTWVGLFINYV